MKCPGRQPNIETRFSLKKLIDSIQETHDLIPANNLVSKHLLQALEDEGFKYSEDLILSRFEFDTVLSRAMNYCRNDFENRIWKHIEENKIQETK